MKRFLLFVSAVAAILLAGSCQQEINPVTDGDTTVTFTVSADDIATRAGIADGTNIDVLHWEIYKTAEIANAAGPLGEDTIVEKDGNKEFTVDLKLLADQDYTIIFWAEVDGNDHYDTDDLRNVEVNFTEVIDPETGEATLAVDANDESRAAFFAVYPFSTENGVAIKETVKLLRPFSQINLGSTTYETSFNKVNGGNVKVETTEMTVTDIATSFNTLTGKGEGEQKVIFKAAATPNGVKDATDKILEVNDLYYYWLGMNYLIVCGDSDNVEVDVTLVTNFGDVNHTVHSVPVKENYRTNLLGNFLTTGATFNVVVDEKFQKPDEIVPVPGEDGNGSSNTYTVANAADLVWLQQQVNKSGKDFKGKTVKLMADIDLGGAEWTPIDGFEGTFDGSKGTKAADDNYTISNFTVNVEKLGGLFGSVNGTIKNVNVENATVTSSHYAGALAGYVYGRVENCHAKNVSVTAVPVKNAAGIYDDGNHAGGLVGYIAGEPMSYLVNNSVMNATVTAYRDLGGVVGCLAGKMTVEGNTAVDCDIVVDRVLDAAYNGDKNENAGAVAGRNASANITTDQFNEINAASEDEVEIKETQTPSEEEGQTLAELVQTPGAVIELPAGEYIFPSGNFESGVTLYCEEGTVFTGNSKLNIKGSTIVGATFSNPSGTAVDQTINGTFKDCVFEGSNALRWCYTGETVVFENCVFSGDVYGVHFDGGANEVLFKNCTFSGFNALGGAIKLATIDGCTFKSNGKSGYNGINLWGNTKVINTEFTFDGSAANEWVDICGSSTGEYTFNGCTVCGEPMAIPEIGVYPSDDKVNEVDITFNGVYYENYKTNTFISTAEDLVAFAKEVNENGNTFSGKTVYLMADIDLANDPWTPIGQTGATQFKGTFDGNNKTISNLNIDARANTSGNCASGIFGWLNSAVVKNIKVDGVVLKGNHNVGVIAGYLETSGCTVENCHVSKAQVECHVANDDANGDKAGVVVGHAGNAGVRVENCTASESTLSAGRDAGQVVGAAKSENVVNCSATNVTVTANGEGTGANIRNEVIGRIL